MSALALFPPPELLDADSSAPRFSYSKTFHQPGTVYYSGASTRHSLAADSVSGSASVINVVERIAVSGSDGDVGEWGDSSSGGEGRLMGSLGASFPSLPGLF